MIVCPSPLPEAGKGENAIFGGCVTQLALDNATPKPPEKKPNSRNNGVAFNKVELTSTQPFPVVTTTAGGDAVYNNELTIDLGRGLFVDAVLSAKRQRLRDCHASFAEPQSARNDNRESLSLRGGFATKQSHLQRRRLRPSLVGAGQVNRTGSAIILFPTYTHQKQIACPGTRPADSLE